MDRRPKLTLYGTLTSPYVRRVRAVAHELDLEVERVDTADDSGQASLRARNPLWRIPTVELEGGFIFDSRVICEYLVREHGRGRLALPDPRNVDDTNRLTVIDGVLDTLINVFYLERDGVEAVEGSYVAKHKARAEASMAWLEARAKAGWITSSHTFGLAEINLVTALEWMRFRETYPVDQHPALMRCLEVHADRGSLYATRPPGYAPS